MNSKTVKLIRRYSRLRSAKDKRLSYKTFKKIYKEATPAKRKEYEHEMLEYIHMVESGVIDQGDSKFAAVVKGGVETAH